MLILKHIFKRYQYQKVLDDVSLELPECGMIAIIGPSGCGKSTLLHIIGGIDKDFEGEMRYGDKNVKKHLTHYRQQHVSFIFQQFHLIMWLSTLQNMKLSQYFQKITTEECPLDITDFESLKMSSLSLGQRQRIAYLRAYYQQSDILLCDEPTGSLDPQHAQVVMKLLKEESCKRLVIIVSHDLKLVEKFSDMIYEMQDGKIIHQKHLHSPIKQKAQSHQKKKKHFALLRLSWLSLLSHKSRSFQLVFGLTLSLLCIVFTLTMSRGLETQIHDYIYSLIPSSSLSFQSQNHQSLTLNIAKSLTSESGVIRTQLYLDDYECLGIGFVKERYQESQVLFIGDDASPYQDIPLELGKLPQSDHEILVSLSTARHLCQQDDLSTLIDKTLYAWYKYQNQVKAIPYHVVGITNQSTTMDTLYQRENAYIHLLRDVYQFDEEQVKSSLGIIYIDKQSQRSDVIKQLQQNYPLYQFKEVGKTTTENISETMKQVQIVLIVFSILAILSSLFLIGEVMFLNVVQKKKDLAILKCFGASAFSLLRIVLYESLEIVFCAQFICTLIYYQLIHMINLFIHEVLFNENMTFAFDYSLLLGVFGLSIGLVLISQLAPLLYVLRLNTIAALKD